MMVRRLRVLSLEEALFLPKKVSAPPETTPESERFLEFCKRIAIMINTASTMMSIPNTKLSVDKLFTAAVIIFPP
jgi:hypothetical protein